MEISLLVDLLWSLSRIGDASLENKRIIKLTSNWIGEKVFILPLIALSDTCVFIMRLLGDKTRRQLSHLLRVEVSVFYLWWVHHQFSKISLSLFLLPGEMNKQPYAFNMAIVIKTLIIPKLLIYRKCLVVPIFVGARLFALLNQQLKRVDVEILNSYEQFKKAIWFWLKKTLKL